MLNLLTPAQLRLLSRSELEDAFLETQDAYIDSKDELELVAAEKISLSSTNERLSRKLKEEKASKIQLKNDYRQLIKEMQAGNSDALSQELREGQSDNRTPTQDTKAPKDAKAREDVNIIHTSSTSPRSPSSSMIQETLVQKTHLTVTYSLVQRTPTWNRTHLIQTSAHNSQHFSVFACICTVLDSTHANTSLGLCPTLRNDETNPEPEHPAISRSGAAKIRDSTEDSSQT
ncbi:MAG: hypothetical protein L6R42_000990 [Xanthoria sp. 1 TBL-2021]|nr:MAG: hypothetical protein L6R42_000990 [Xanthoria sp. 1 TBL-2021]